MNGSLIFSGVSFYVTPGERKRELVAKIRENGGEVLSKYHPDAINLLAIKTVSSTLLSNKQSESSTVYVAQFVDDCIEEKRCLPKKDYTLHAFLARANPRGDESGTTRKQRQKYTKAEKLQVLMYGEDAKSKGHCVAGNELWKTAETMRVTSHSWQSMRTQYQELSRLSQAEQRRLYHEVMQSLRVGDYESSTDASSRGRETSSVESRAPLSSVAAFDSRVVSNKLDISKLMEGGGLAGESQNEEEDNCSQGIKEERTTNRPKSLSAGRLEDLSKSKRHVEPHSPSSLEDSGNAVGKEGNAVEVRNRSPLALTKEEMEDSQLMDCFSTQAMTQAALAGSPKTIGGRFEWRMPEKGSNDVAKAVREESQESGEEEEEEDDDSEQFDEARLLNMKEKFETDQARDRQLQEECEERRLVGARERERMKNTQAEKLAELESPANDRRDQKSDGKKADSITGVSSKPGEEVEKSCGSSASSQLERPVKVGINGGESSVNHATGQQHKTTAESKGARTLHVSHVDEQDESIRTNKQSDAASSGDTEITKGKQCGSEKEVYLETKQGLESEGIKEKVDGEMRGKESAVIAGRCDAGDSLENDSRSDDRDGKICDIQHFKSSGSSSGDIAATGKEEDARKLHSAKRCPAVDTEQKKVPRSSMLSDTVNNEERSSSDSTEGLGGANSQLSRNTDDLDTSKVASDELESENGTDADESTSRNFDDTDEDDEALTDTDVAQTQIVDKGEGFGRTGKKDVHCSRTESGEVQEQEGKYGEKTKIELDDLESRNRGEKVKHDVTASVLRGVDDEKDGFEGIADASAKTQRASDQGEGPGSILSSSSGEVMDKIIRADESSSKFDEGSTTESEDDLPLTQLKFVRQKQMMRKREVDSVSDTGSGASDRRRDTEGVGGSQPRDDEVEVDTSKLRNSPTEGRISISTVEMQAESKEKGDEVEGDFEQTQVLSYGEESESDGHGEKGAHSRITQQIGPLTRQKKNRSDSWTEVDESEEAGAETVEDSNEEAELQKEATLKENHKRVKRKRKSRLRRELELLKEDVAGKVLAMEKATTREDMKQGGDDANEGVTQKDETEGGELRESMRSQGRLTKQQSSRRRTRRSGQDSPATRSKRRTLETERVSNNENDRRETDDSISRSASSRRRTRSQDEDTQPRTALAQVDPSKDVTADKNRPPHPVIEEAATPDLRNQSLKSADEAGESGKSLGERATRARAGSGDVLESEVGEPERGGKTSHGRKFPPGGARQSDAKRKGKQSRSRKSMGNDDGLYELSSDEIENRKELTNASEQYLEIFTQECSISEAARFTNKRRRDARRTRWESAQDRKGLGLADVDADSSECIYDSQPTSINGSGPGRKVHKRQAIGSKIGSKITQGARIGTNTSEEDESLGVVEEDARGIARGTEKGQSSLRLRGVRGLINRVSRYSNQSEAAATHMLYLCNGDEDLAVRMLSGGFNPKMLRRDRTRALWTKEEDVILKRVLKSNHVSVNWVQLRTRVMADQRVQKIVSKRGRKAVIDRCRFLLG